MKGRVMVYKHFVKHKGGLLKNLALRTDLSHLVIEAADYYRAECSKHRNGVGHPTAAVRGVDYILGLGLRFQGYTHSQVARALGRKESTLTEALAAAQQRLVIYAKLKELGRL